MGRRLGVCALGFAVLIALCCVPLRVDGDGATAPSCGLSGVWDLAYVLGRPIDDATLRDLQRAYPGAEVSLLDVRDIAARVGIDLVGVQASLDDLLPDGRLPAVMHLADPDHFVVVTRVSPEWVQAMDRGGVHVYARKTLEKRYTQHALVLTPRDQPVAGPRLDLPAFHSTFAITGPGQRVTREFACANGGDQDLRLGIRVAGG